MCVIIPNVTRNNKPSAERSIKERDASDFSERDRSRTDMLSAFAMGSNTSSLIAWDMLGERLAAAGAAITDEQRVALIVQLANGRDLTSAQFNQLAGVQVLKGGGEKPWGITQEKRDGIRTRLGRAITEPRALANMETHVRGNVLLLPEGGGYRVIARDMDVALVYAITRAARSERKVRRCKREACGDFFLVPRKGRPSLYCPGKDCGRRTDDEAAASRMEKIRRKRK